MHWDVGVVSILQIAQQVALVPALGGSVFSILCLVAVSRFCRGDRGLRKTADVELPPVTILKPVHGLEKNLRENLRSTCLQDYPEFQVVFSVQDTDDPAIPLINEIVREFGPKRVSLAVKEHRLGTNGKINNLAGALEEARHELLVISDSDVRLRPDYLRNITAPLVDPDVGCVSTLYRAACAQKWYERIEMMTLNADLIPSVVFAHTTGASKVVLGASTALRRSTLERIGGLHALADYLVEDFEMGRRIAQSGGKIIVLPYMVETIVDLRSASQWWGHQVYWDQNNRAARPIAYFLTLLIKAVPFALLYALLRMDTAGLAVLAGALGLRLLTAAIIMGWGFHHLEGLRNVALLPLRDLAALFSFMLAYVKRTTVWRGKEFALTRDGRLVAHGDRE